MSESLTISLHGTTDLPAGKIAAIVTSLEMTARPPVKADPPGTQGLALEQIGPDAIERYIGIYRVLGERWMWFSRLVMPVAELQAILTDPAVRFFALRHQGRDVGLLELDFRVAGEGELAFFGLDDSVIGMGAGRWLMNRALELAWAEAITRFWVHTCTLDHPSAPEFYQRSGFTAFKRGVEVADDPRLSGHLPRESVPHHPVIA
jgi:GNAT superfamily N-acetyltransferase